MLALAGCDDEPESPPAAAKAAATAAPITGRCPVTIADDRIRTHAGEFTHGDRSLAVGLWPNGRLVAGGPADHSVWGQIRPDGTIYAKLGWWRGVDGELRIEGERIDAPAAPLRADIPHGYGPTGFQATALIFPITGCCRVVAAVGDARLEFVTLVRKRGTPAQRARFPSGCSPRGETRGVALSRSAARRAAGPRGARAPAGPTAATRAAPDRRASRSVVTSPVGNTSSSRSVYWTAAVTRGSRYQRPQHAGARRGSRAARRRARRCARWRCAARRRRSRSSRSACRRSPWRFSRGVDVVEHVLAADVGVLRPGRARRTPGSAGSALEELVDGRGDRQPADHHGELAEHVALVAGRLCAARRAARWATST